MHAQCQGGSGKGLYEAETKSDMCVYVLSLFKHTLRREAVDTWIYKRCSESLSMLPAKGCLYLSVSPGRATTLRVRESDQAADSHAIQQLRSHQGLSSLHF